MSDDEHLPGDWIDCWQCGGEGEVIGICWDGCCENAEEGCDVCNSHCDVCRGKGGWEYRPSPAPEEGKKPKGPANEQAAYKLGYDNPARASREWRWPHLVHVNAFGCGQLDRQNNAPYNPAYRADDYEFPSCERLSPAPEEGKK